ncbi:Uma2 family endonuclease [Catenovulum agarivorans]|uniref:Uma2 family endonuclease n=1 Tax=Catenovulum agarivorans TaxID=1172192 RepID=UPI0002D9C63A|nr:Uma2 family endonuclease [Catenovulum agarivorans]
MSVVSKPSTLTVDEYLQGELVSDIKHEFVDGQVYAMAGASANHNRICGNVLRNFGNHLYNSKCEAHMSDMKVKTPLGNYRYPDVLVVCDNNYINDSYATETPTILVEVISKSTRKTDEQIKRMEYINIPTLQEYVIIEQDYVDVAVFRKSDDWRHTNYFLGDEIHFESINLTLSVEEIYHRVDNLDVIEYLQQKQEELE